MSNIEITIDWDSPAIFAGQNIACTITFKNVAPVLPPPESPYYMVEKAAQPRCRHWKFDAPRQLPITVRRTLPPRQSNNRPAQPIEMQQCYPLLPPTYGQATVLSSSKSQRVVYDTSLASRAQKHNRSVSINALGPKHHKVESDYRSGKGAPSSDGGKFHSRANSLQNASRTAHSRTASSLLSWLTTGREAGSSQYRLDRTIESSYWYQNLPLEDGGPGSGLMCGSQRESPQGSNTLRVISSGIEGGETTHAPHPPNSEERPTNPLDLEPLSNSTRDERGEDFLLDLDGTRKSQLSSPLHTTETPRSSIESHSQGNQSTESLTSEYVLPRIAEATVRVSEVPHMTRSPCSHASTPSAATIMMGYVQLTGSFTLDSSLIKVGLFEPIKKKGIIGGQDGGGVVGVGSSKSDSGMFASLGWSNFSHSLGGLIGPQEPSTMRVMKGMASAKAVPIISTPQSVLFVDLVLEAGEMRSFRYTYLLPSTLPPSCKGRAMKVGYQLTVGIQCPRASSRSHHLRYVNIPFRVLPHVLGMAFTVSQLLFSYYR